MQIVVPITSKLRLEVRIKIRRNDVWFTRLMRKCNLMTRLYCEYQIVYRYNLLDTNFWCFIMI